MPKLQRDEQSKTCVILHGLEWNYCKRIQRMKGAKIKKLTVIIFHNNFIRNQQMQHDDLSAHSLPSFTKYKNLSKFSPPNSDNAISVRKLNSFKVIAVCSVRSPLPGVSNTFENDLINKKKKLTANGANCLIRHFVCRATFCVCRWPNRIRTYEKRTARNESNHIHFVNCLVSVSHLSWDVKRKFIKMAIRIFNHFFSVCNCRLCLTRQKHNCFSSTKRYIRCSAIQRFAFSLYSCNWNANYE